MLFWALCPGELISYLLTVTEREEGGTFKTRSMLESVARYEPSTYQPINRLLRHCAIEACYYVLVVCLQI